MFNEVGTSRLDGIMASTWIFMTRSTSLASRPTLESARFSTTRNRSRGNPIVIKVSRALPRCLTPTTSRPVTRQMMSLRSKHTSAESE